MKNIKVTFKSNLEQTPKAESSVIAYGDNWIIVPEHMKLMYTNPNDPLIYPQVKSVEETEHAQYWYQIPPQTSIPGWRWEDSKPFVMDFATRADAHRAAQLLSQVNGGAQIRWADNPNYKSNSGCYTTYLKRLIDGYFNS